MMISYLQAENLERRIGDRLLFNQITLNINKDDKVAIIAVNGAGKSSLLDILAGLESPDKGSMSFRRDLKIAYLRQNPDLNEGNRIIDELFSTGSPVTETIRDYEECLISGTPEQMEKLIQKMDDLKAWEYETSVRQILFRLKLTDLNARIGSLSGGQKKRVALAKVLAEEADLLILDEPTNHLDLEMIEWLEEFLIKSNRTILMVTHDRYFLDRVCNVILELFPGGLFRYEGNYEYFLEKKQGREYSEKMNTEKARNLLKTELEWMRKMPKARRHKARHRIDSFYDLQEKAAGKQDIKSININVGVSRMGSKILDIKNISKSYDDLTLIKDFSYNFNRFEKVGLVGKNGCGKSTLLNLLTGLIPPDKGTIEKGETIVFGYYRQQGIQFDDDMTVYDAAKEISENVTLSNGSSQSVSQFMNYFLFPPDKQYTYIRKLSGGEKRRLYLLTVLMRNPNFLILDEPTNDLDILTLNVLEEYLSVFKGCVIIVSHDRYFMDKVVDHVFEFSGDAVIKDFPGNYTQLRDWQEENEKKVESAAPVKEVVAVQTQEKRSRSTNRAGFTFREKQEFEKLTTEIETLESELKEIEMSLDNGITDQKELFSLSQRHGEIKNLLNDRELRWLELSEKQ